MGKGDKPAAAAVAAAPAKHAPVVVEDDEVQAAPLSKRSIDIWLSFWFLLFAFSTTFTDIHNFTASVRGVDVTALEGKTDLVWPPKILTDVYFRWARTVDPLLYQNPVWWCVGSRWQADPIARAVKPCGGMRAECCAAFVSKADHTNDML